MRIALVSQEYPPETAHGGIGTQTHLKAHGLATLGHGVCVVSHSTDAERHEYRDASVTVVRVPGFDARLPIHTESVRWLTWSAEVASAVATLHAGAPLDVVDFPEFGGDGCLHLLNRTAGNYIPTVVHLHGPLVMLAQTIQWPEIQSEFYRTGTAMEETCVRLADAVFSSSSCSADWCARHYGVPRDRIPVLHTGVDTRLFYPHEIPRESRPTIVFVGQIVRNKGVELLLEAACQLAREYPDLCLRLLGRGDEGMIKRLQETARACGLPHLLEVPGIVHRHDLPAHLSRAHIFAAPSQYEGGPGFVYLEAMACGLPVIACSGSGAAEVVIPEVNGLLVPPGDVHALVQALGRLLTNAQEREAMGARARRYVVETADSAVCLNRLEDFYITAAKKTGSAGAL